MKRLMFILFVFFAFIGVSQVQQHGQFYGNDVSDDSVYYFSFDGLTANGAWELTTTAPNDSNKLVYVTDGGIITTASISDLPALDLRYFSLNGDHTVSVHIPYGQGNSNVNLTVKIIVYDPGIIITQSTNFATPQTMNEGLLVFEFNDTSWSSFDSDDNLGLQFSYVNNSGSGQPVYVATGESYSKVEFSIK